METFVWADRSKLQYRDSQTVRISCLSLFVFSQMTQVFYLYKNEPKILTWLSKMPEGLPEMECRGDGGGDGGEGG